MEEFELKPIRPTDIVHNEIAISQPRINAEGEAYIKKSMEERKGIDLNAVSQLASTGLGILQLFKQPNQPQPMMFNEPYIPPRKDNTMVVVLISVLVVGAVVFAVIKMKK